MNFNIWAGMDGIRIQHEADKNIHLIDYDKAVELRDQLTKLITMCHPELLDKLAE